MSLQFPPEQWSKLNLIPWDLDVSTLTMTMRRGDECKTINFLFWQETIHPQDRDIVVNTILETINEKRPSFDCQLRIQSGESRWTMYRMRGAPVITDPTSRLSRLSGVLEDFSLLEQKLGDLQRKVAMLEAQAKERNDFFASITHELRTPLTGVLGLADLLIDTENLSEEQISLTQSIRQCGSSLLSLINDTLDLSKLEARKLSLVPTKFALRSLVSDIENLFTGKFIQKKHTFVAFVGDDVPDEIVADPRRLQQILVNLIGNAQKFTPSGGGICLRVELESKTPKSADILFSVIDSGIGIKSENQKDIFKEYAQEDQHTALNFGGTGLGLSIAGELVGLFGGDLKVRSEPGRGTVFQFGIHVATSTANTEAPTHAVTPVPVNRRPLRILLAEDNLVNQKVASRMLEKIGHRVIIADNGREALRLYEQESFDLILMDIQMPLMSGEQATHSIREKEKGTSKRPTPIIALTAHAMSGDREKYIALGMNDYVSKPIDKQALFEAIWRAVET